MIDFSTFISWPFVASGLPVSIWMGYRMSNLKGFDRIVPAGLMAFGQALALSFATSAFHMACIESLHWCLSRGGSNMSYWFHPILAFPLYWAIIGVSRPSRKKVRYSVGVQLRSQRVEQPSAQG